MQVGTLSERVASSYRAPPPLAKTRHGGIVHSSFPHQGARCASLQREDGRIAPYPRPQ